MNAILLNGLLYEPQGTGISVYTGHLVQELLKKNNIDIDFLLRKTYSDKYSEYSQVSYATKDICSSKDRILYEQIYGLKDYKWYELIHFPDYASSMLYKGKKIITVHDMAMYTMKEAYTSKQVLVKQYLLKQSLRNVDGIICDSNFAKKELLTYFPKIDPDKIKVIYLGINDSIPYNKGHEAEVKEKFNIKKPYLLYVGTLAPSKNVARLIRSFDSMKDTGYDMQLLLVGKKGWMNEEIEEAYEHSKHQKDIQFTGFVTKEELEALYGQACVYISPSLYEGFGLTPLEAMKRGVPVAVSDIEIFREVCGNVVEYFDPRDIAHMASTIIKLIDNPDRRIELVNKAKEYVEKFTWSETATQTYEFYQEVLKK